MASVYRKVKVSETHVGKIWMFFTADGTEVFGTCHLDIIPFKWFCQDWRGIKIEITHALEEAKVPTKEEIQKYEPYETGEVRYALNRSWYNGALWAVREILEKGE